MELVFVALDHGIDSVTEGGPLIPFALTETSDGRDLSRFATETLEEGQARARDHVRAAGADRAAIAYDGYLTVEGDGTTRSSSKRRSAAKATRSCLRSATAPAAGSRSSRRSATPRSSSVARTFLVGDRDGFLARQAARDDLRDAVAAHRDAVEDVRRLHRPLLVRDHDELGAVGIAA